MVGWEEKMVRCPKHKVDSASIRAVVMVCPECGRILDSGELLRLLKRLGFSKRLVKQVQVEARKKNLGKKS
jgi:Zn-finger nucleic acid-binding protein